MYEIIAIEEEIDINRDYTWMTIRELYVKPKHKGYYYLLRSQFSGFNKRG